MTRSLYIILYALLLLLPARTPKAQEQTAPWDHTAIRYNPWEISLNPAGTYHTPIDSLAEASLSYLASRQALAASDEPDHTQTLTASVNGSRRLGKLRVTGGICWEQDLRDGREWNFLTLPGYLVAAGDTVNDRQGVERYRIYGKAAYLLTPRLTVGIGGDYMAIDNQDRTPNEQYSGKAHRIDIAGGLIYQIRHTRLGLGLHYSHRTEGLYYASKQEENRYTYPMGYWSSMSESAGGQGFKSQGNNLGVSLQAERDQRGWHEMHDVHIEVQELNDKPNTLEQIQGWEERRHHLRYKGRVTKSRGRWTHLLSPTLAWTKTTADRVVQYYAPDPPVSWVTLTTCRMANRQEWTGQLHYELARDYSPEGPTLAWQIAAGWNSRKEKAIHYPFTQGQYTTTFRAEAAFLRTWMPTSASHLSLRPSLYLICGGGTEERTETAGNDLDSAEIIHPRSRRRISEDFNARTATRLGTGLEATYKRGIGQGLAAGIRIRASIERTMTHKQENGAAGEISLIVWI